MLDNDNPTEALISYISSTLNSDPVMIFGLVTTHEKLKKQYMSCLESIELFEEQFPKYMEIMKLKGRAFTPQQEFEMKEKQFTLVQKDIDKLVDKVEKELCD